MKHRYPHIHLLNRFSIYWDPYMHTVESEYWTGYNRRKILTLGKYTFWVRDRAARGEK